MSGLATSDELLSSMTTRFRAQGPKNLDEIAQRFGIPDDVREGVRVVSQVLPFRVNEYVLSELIDWSAVPEDPYFQLVFPQAGMLSADDESRVASLVGKPEHKKELRALVKEVRSRLNPHPSGQMELNVPSDGEAELPGMQHKYRETVLYFPSQGQTCHAYCTYCFRWAQFVGDADLKFATPGPETLVQYLQTHPDVTDVLITGGDPMIMGTDRLEQHINPLLEIDTLQTIRIGTKSVAYWPQRFVTDEDADALLRLFEKVVGAGKNIAIMGHYSHPCELETDIAQQALARIRSTGALIYCQAPLIAKVNDAPGVWAEMWRKQLTHGAVPYYMFVERDTGPYEYFKVPLARALDIFQDAYRRLPGLARTVRGPSMSATPGKVLVDGVETVDGQDYFKLKMVQSRDPDLVGRPFRAHYSETAAWLDELELDEQVSPDLVKAIAPTAAEAASTNGKQMLPTVE